MLISELFKKIESNLTNPEEKIDTSGLLKKLIIKTIRDKNFFHFTQTPLKKLSFDNGIELTLDISFIIRPRDIYLGIDLSTLSDDAILSAVTINISSTKSFGSGAFNTSFKSKKQCRYNHMSDSFDIRKTVNTKNIRQSTPVENIDNKQMHELSEDKKAVICRYMGKPEKDTGKGVYFLKNADGKQLSILPYVDGVDFFDFLSSDEIMSTVEPNLRLRKIALDLSLNLARLHALGYMHCDIKPENIIVKNDGSTCFIDLDFITKIDEIITTQKGTAEYYPAYASEIFKKYRKATVYQDIYGTIICILLLLKPDFNDFQEVYKNSVAEEKNPELTVMHYFISTLKNEFGSYFSNIFLPFFLHPEKVTASDLVNQFIYIDTELTQHAIETVTKDNREGQELLELYIQGYNEIGNGMFRKKKERFIVYLGNLLIQNKTFDEADFTKNNFQLITQDHVTKERANLLNKLKNTENPKVLISRSIVYKVIAYLTSDNPDLSNQIFNKYNQYYNACKHEKAKLGIYNKFIQALIQIFERKINSGIYQEHKSFLEYLVKIETDYLMHKKTLTQASTKAPVAVQIPPQSDAQKNSFFIKRSRSADGNLSPNKKKRLSEADDDNIRQQENKRPNEATLNTLENSGQRQLIALV